MRHLESVAKKLDFTHKQNSSKDLNKQVYQIQFYGDSDTKHIEEPLFLKQFGNAPRNSTNPNEWFSNYQTNSISDKRIEKEVRTDIIQSVPTLLLDDNADQDLSTSIKSGAPWKYLYPDKVLSPRLLLG